MTDPNATREAAHEHGDVQKSERRGGHFWLMIVCCIPMLVIAVALVLTGVISPSFLLLAIACTLMMALMMRGMGSDEHRH